MSKTFLLSDGQQIPMVGLGTSTIGDIHSSVSAAIDAGYRHIDSASMYNNEIAIGQAVKSKIEEGAVKREDLYIVTKLNNDKHDPKEVAGAFKKSLENLQTDYVDLYLIHWPCSYYEKETPEGKRLVFTDFDYVDTWLELEKLKKDGRAKSIGLSNFNEEQIERILKICTVKPVVNQVECHLAFNQEPLRAYCEKVGIRLTAFSPLGAPGRSIVAKNAPKLLDNPVVVKLSQKYGKTPSQILLRFNIERGVAVIPKSNNPERLKENLNICDFVISEEDLAELMACDLNIRFVRSLNMAGSQYYPFKKEMPFKEFE